MTEEELKQFDEEYSKCKDTIVRTYSTIKTEILQGTVHNYQR